MKIKIIVLVFLLAVSGAYADENNITSPAGTAIPVSAPAAGESRSLEKQADAMYPALEKIRDNIAGQEMAGRILDLYKKAIGLDKTNEKLIHKYAKLIQIKYNQMIPDGERDEEKHRVYDENLEYFKQIYPGDNLSIYATFDIDLMLMLCAEHYNPFQAIGTVNQLKDYTERIYNEDKSFEKYMSAVVLGRLNFLAPNIIFIIGWPDKNKSKQYLEEASEHNPTSLITKYFLADTLYGLGEKERAIKLFNDVITATPSDSILYFEDKKVQRNTAVRMKELGIEQITDPKSQITK